MIAKSAWLLRHADHRRPQQAVLDHVARSAFPAPRCRARPRRWDFEHRLVLVGVERQADRGDAGDAVLAEHLVELALGRLDPGDEALQARRRRAARRGSRRSRGRGCRPPTGCRARSRSRRKRARRRRPFPSGGARSASRPWRRARPACAVSRSSCSAAERVSTGRFAVQRLRLRRACRRARRRVPSRRPRRPAVRLPFLSIIVFPSLSDEFAQRSGGEIHHGDHARVIQPRGADHPEHADHPALAVAIGRRRSPTSPTARTAGSRCR